MLLSSHRFQFRRCHDHGMRRNEDHIAAREQEDQVFDVPLIFLSPSHPAHRLPQIIIGTQEEDADHRRLNDEEPGEQTAHERDSHLLAIGIDFAHQPIPGEGQRDQERHTEGHGDITHPIVVCTVFVCLRRQELVRGISRHDTAAECHVAQNTMEIKRIPQRGMNDVPDVAEIPALFINAGRRHHETDPGIRQEHEQGADDVQNDRHAQMNPLQEPFLHLVPTIIVDVEGSALRDEHQRVDVHDRTEDTG